MRRFWWLLGGVVVVAVAVAVFFGVRDHRSGKAYVAPAPPATLGLSASPEDRATAACQDMKTVQSLVRRNASQDSVFDYLKAASAELTIAVSQEPRWLSLQSGVSSVQSGLQVDNASATQLGIAIVRYQCMSTGVSLS